MNRRNILKSIAGAGLASLLTPREEKAQQAVEKAVRGLSRPKIKDITVIETAPAGSRLDVVKITTDQDGLYGYGCATFTQRADLIKPAVDRYLKPLLKTTPSTRSKTSGRPATTVPTGKTARCSTTRSAVSTRRFGISKAAWPTCLSTIWSAANAVKPPMSTPTPMAARSSRSSTTRSAT